jgi:glutathione S-transferase
MGQLEKPSMLDFAVFPQLVFGYMFGLEKQLSAARHPTIKAWLAQVFEYLPENPTLASNKMQINSLSKALS